MSEIHAFRDLIAAANEVSRRGAETGPQWTKLTIALLKAKPAADRLATKDATIERLRLALEWYADKANHEVVEIRELVERGMFAGVYTTVSRDSLVEVDGGSLARAALEAKP